VKHAFVPALISYIALVYIVHLEALKLGLKGLPKPDTGRTKAQSLMLFVGGFLATMILFGLVYYGLGWVKTAFPNMTFTTVIALFLLAYVLLAWKAAKYPDLEPDDPNAPITELPRAGQVAITGLYYIIPIIMLIWLIMIERMSAGTSAYYAVLAMSFIALTQHALKGFFRGNLDLAKQIRQGFSEWVEGLIAGARSMIAIAVATGAAGIIVGTIGLTGAHQVIGSFVEYLSAGSLIVMLLLVAVMSLILGMGLPTTANYIVVSSLMAPVIISVGAQNGLLLPAVAAHLFVFYFGILADDTPPVGLAAFAAAAISGGDPIKTGIQGFTYDIRTAILPFLFVFNTELLLINVGTAAHQRGASEGHLRVHRRGDSHAALRLGDPGLHVREEPALGDRGHAADRLHPVPSGLLARHGAATVHRARRHPDHGSGEEDARRRAAAAARRGAGLQQSGPHQGHDDQSGDEGGRKSAGAAGEIGPDDRAEGRKGRAGGTHGRHAVLWRNPWPARRSSRFRSSSTSMPTSRSSSRVSTSMPSGCRRRCSTSPRPCCWGWCSCRSWRGGVGRTPNLPRQHEEE